MSNQHGGRRTPQPGRTPHPETKYIAITAKLPPHQIEWLKAHKLKTGQARNAFIVQAIEQAMKLREPP